jgi:hypothetical protein
MLLKRRMNTALIDTRRPRYAKCFSISHSTVSTRLQTAEFTSIDQPKLNND